MNQVLLVAAAVVGGLVAGYGTHRLNQALARGEDDATERPLPMEWLWAPLLDAALLGFLVFRFGLSPQTYVGIALVLVLVQVLVFDARHRLILNRIIYPAMAAALLVAPLNPLLQVSGAGVRDHVVSSILGAVVGGGLFLIAVLVTGGGVGLGDAKLSFFLGATLGLLPIFGSPTLRALLYGVLLGGVVALGLILTRVRGMRDYIPYGPYLCAGGLLSLLFPCGIPGPASC